MDKFQNSSKTQKFVVCSLLFHFCFTFVSLLFPFPKIWFKNFPKIWFKNFPFPKIWFLNQILGKFKNQILGKGKGNGKGNGKGKGPKTILVKRTHSFF
jgi:hypothetical protein